MDLGLEESRHNQSSNKNALEDQKLISELSGNISNLHLESTESMIPFKMRSKCFKCSRTEGLVSFLCNHTICKNCLARECFQQIKNFELSIKSYPDASQIFHYFCFHERCFSMINVPTRMVC